MPGRLDLAASAKLNLYLHVTGRRPDGFHLLDGLVGFADIGDQLAIEPAARLTFTADGPFAADLGNDPSTNLVVRAALALAQAMGRKADFALRLTKTLPVASGIGGGSADAAACLRGLAALWGIDPAGEVVMGVAARLGSDVPACVVGSACYLGGIGSDLTPAPGLPPAGVLLVNPRVALPTPAVYRARQGGFSPAMRLEPMPADAAGLARALARRSNDLTAPAVALVPQIAAVLRAIADMPDCLLSRMSGSGATCFGLFADAAAAAAAAAKIVRIHADWWIASGRLLSDAHAPTGV